MGFSPCGFLRLTGGNASKSKISTSIKYIAIFLTIQFLFTICGAAASTINKSTAPLKLRMSEKYAPYTHPTVLDPFPDGVSLKVPTEPGNQALAQLGLVDVTEAPFYADPTGKKDSTGPLQRAIIYARNHQMICFLPNGTYKVSDTLSCIQDFYLRSHGIINAGRRHPCVLVGSMTGKRPKIVLAPNSPGFGDPDNPKYVVHFWARSAHTGEPHKPQPNISFDQMLRNIDITIGQDNPGAVAIRHRCAQGSGVQDCTIDATHGLTGLEGGAGSGGGHAGITIIGGKIGLDLRQTQPAPTICGITLINQRKNAILYGGRQSLSAVGVRIVSKTSGPSILATAPRWGPHNGQVCLVDSEIIFKGEAENRVALSSDRALYLNNVYIKNADHIISNPDGYQLKSNARGWAHVRELAHAAHPEKWKNLPYRAPIYIEGGKQSQDIVSITVNEAPPANLQTRHLWDDSFPCRQSKKAVNVKASPYNAKGDGQADDTQAIQRAIDENEIVFVPKGYYRVTKTITLHSKTRLVGVAQHLSLLLVRNAEGDFADADNPQPVVQTVDDRHADTVFAFCGIYVAREMGGAYAMEWRAGRNSICRCVNFIRRNLYGHSRHPQGLQPHKAQVPLVVVRGAGGGRWYNFHQESHDRFITPAYRHLLIENTTEPLYIYQCNAENAHSKVNIEMHRAHNVSLYGLKGEGNMPILQVRDSDNIRIFGYGGNAAAYEKTALFVFERTANFLIANAVDSPRLAGVGSEDDYGGIGVDPYQWYMIIDRPAEGKPVRTAPLDRPVLYRRGEPNR